MPTSTYQHDLPGVLDVLAGTTGRDVNKAASAWASLTTTTDMLNALNQKNGTSGLDFNAVCCALAGVATRDGLAALLTLVTPSVGVDMVLDPEGNNFLDQSSKAVRTQN